MYIKYQPIAKLLNIVFLFFILFLSFIMCIHLLLRDHKPLPQFNATTPSTPTKRQEPVSNFNTITYFYIYIHLHKKTKAKQFILSKDKSKSQDSQHKSDKRMKANKPHT